MTIHIDPKLVARAHAGVPRAQLMKIKGFLPLKWGNAPRFKSVPNSRVLNGPAFDPQHAPDSARLVPFIELDAFHCHWGIGHDAEQLFCGAPIEAGQKGSRLRRRYCAHHAAMVGVTP